MVGPILSGAVLGVLFLALAHRRGGGGEFDLLAAGLLVAALIYFVLAIPARDSQWVLLEAVGVVVFAGIAWVGRWAPWWLGLGWMAHAGWDIGLHLDRAQTLVHRWYPLGCVGFDLIVAGFIFSAALSSARPRREAA